VSLDVDLLRDRLDRYAANIDQFSAKEGGDDELSEVLDWLVINAPLAEAILDRLGEPHDKPDLNGGWMHPGHAFLSYRGPCLRAMGRLGDLQIIESLKPQGPQLNATGLHPWVWDAAASLWNTGHHRQAVSAAAGALSAQTQALLDRSDVNDQELMKEAFSLNDPAQRVARLRVASDMTNKFDRALQQGALNFAQGIYGVIRNPAAHETEEWDEQEALEKLTTLSVLARMIQAAEIVKAQVGKG
jgi:hypothetical protein